MLTPHLTSSYQISHLALLLVVGRARIKLPVDGVKKHLREWS
jgi:hypothetical protein